MDSINQVTRMGGEIWDRSRGLDWGKKEIQFDPY